MVSCAVDGDPHEKLLPAQLRLTGGITAHPLMYILSDNTSSPPSCTLTTTSLLRPQQQYGTCTRLTHYHTLTHLVIVSETLELQHEHN